MSRRWAGQLPAKGSVKETRAPPVGALLGPDRAALGFDQPPGDREAEARTAVCLSGRVVSPEPVEHPPGGFRCEAFARVLDRDPDVIEGCGERHCDRPVGRRVVKGVREQVQQDALDLRGRAAGLGDAVVDASLQRDVSGAGLGLEAADAGLDDGGERDLLQLVDERACVDAGELEEIVDKDGQAPRLVMQGGEVLRRRRQTVLDRLEHRRDRGHGGPQIVARGRDELPPSIEEVFEAAGHRIERPAELGELARASLGCAGAEVTGGERGGGGAKPVDPPRDRCRQHERRSYGRRRGSCGDGEDLDVIAHVEHHPAREQHCEQRQNDGEQRESSQLQPHAGEKAERKRCSQADCKGSGGNGDGERDHGRNL